MVVLTRKKDGQRFTYRFDSREQAQAFATRNRQELPDGIPSPYRVKGPMKVGR